MFNVSLAWASNAGSSSPEGLRLEETTAHHQQRQVTTEEATSPLLGTA